MKVLKVLFVIVFVLVGIWVVLAAIAPSTLLVQKTVSVNTSVSTVFKQVVCFDKWPRWSPWDAMDPTNTNEYSEDPCGQGAWNSWRGDQTGSGKQVITEMRENEYIKTSLVFNEAPEPQTSEWFFVETEGGVEVTWNYIGTEASFFKRPMNLIGKYFLTSAYESGLEALKQVAESAPVVEEISYDIKEIELPKVNYLLVSGDVKPENIGEFYGENFGLIMGYMTERGVEMAGHPTGLFYNWTDTLAKMSAAIPVASDVEGTDEIEFRAVEACKALQIDYYGAYDLTGDAHYTIDDFMEENGLQMAGSVREVYVTDPMSEPDTSKWLTQIIYPVSLAE